MLAWSFGWTGPFSPSGWPRISLARFAMTSFPFMFVDVPLPVWNTSRGNWASSLPSITSWQAWTIAFPILESSRPSSMFVWAAAILMSPSA